MPIRRTAERSKSARRSVRRKRGQNRNVHCPLCGTDRSFCWTCECGLVICQECMQRDIWGFSCNNLTWVCPDCGAIHSF